MCCVVSFHSWMAFPPRTIFTKVWTIFVNWDDREQVSFQKYSYFERKIKMNILLCLERILSEFQRLFNTDDGRLTRLYQSIPLKTRYWSFVRKPRAASSTKLIFSTQQPVAEHRNVSKICQHLGIHWYQPCKLIQGRRGAYLQSQIRALRFSASFKEKTNS